MTTDIKALAPRAKRFGKFTMLVALFSIPFMALLLIRFFILQPFSIPSTSNEPSLMSGDHVLVSKLAYRTDDPQRGDIAVFKLPADPSIDYVHRVIGVPGDRIQIRQGIVYLNDQTLKQEPVTLNPILASQPGMTFFRETLPNGRSYVIANLIDENATDNTDVYVVPEGQYFVLGDNRDNSLDSRFAEQVGYIPRANFVGRYVFRYWNTKGIPLTGRPEEIYPTP